MVIVISILILNSSSSSSNMMQAERLATYFHMDDTTEPQEVMGLKDKGPDAEEDPESADHADEDDVSDDDATTSFREMTFMESFFRSRSCAICTIVVLSILTVASLVALITVAVLVASPYQKAAGFHLSECKVESTTEDEKGKICSCGKGCNAEFPCLHIVVRYRNFRNAAFEETLFDNEANLHKEVGVDKFMSLLGRSNGNKTSFCALFKGGFIGYGR